MKKVIMPIVGVATCTSLLTAIAYGQISDKITKSNTAQPENKITLASYSDNNAGAPVDFTQAAESSVPSVVHITIMKKSQKVSTSDFFDPFGIFGGQGGEFETGPTRAAGSGVIISQDGYIVTNNHVVDGADTVRVTFNDRNTEVAKVIGTDPSTDLAVIKINKTGLPALPFGNSDKIKLGQWVLAIGYPLDLDATVTAGIVSAKGRSIGINKRNSNSAIESFIQTDAAINPGNSGGALVNTDGQLIGINSAIASPTGSYAGYGYAIPSNLVAKVANDIIKYGAVQRGYLGAELVDLSSKQFTSESAAKLGITKDQFENAKGVYVNKINPKGGAEAAGLKKGDFITAVDGVSINASPVLIEQIASKKPGDKVRISYTRNGNSYNTDVVLKNRDGNMSIVKGSENALVWGAKVKNLSNEIAQKMGIKGGVEVTDIGSGDLAVTNIQKGFIINSINDMPVKNVSDLQNAISSIGDSNIQIGGMYPGRHSIYYYNLNLSNGTSSEN